MEMQLLLTSEKEKKTSNYYTRVKIKNREQKVCLCSEPELRQKNRKSFFAPAVGATRRPWVQLFKFFKVQLNF